MNKEQIIDEVYNKYLVYTIEGVKNGFDRIKGYLDNCLVEYDGYYEHFTNPSFAYGYRTYNQEEFINKIKTDTEFSEKWGLKIEERELNLDERAKLHSNPENFYEIHGTFSIGDSIENSNFPDKDWLHEQFDNGGIPTKLITINYNGQIQESYE